jgi:hypothetical protein
MTGQMCGEQAGARPCGRCGAATDQETPVDEAETVALPVPETSNQRILRIGSTNLSVHTMGTNCALRGRQTAVLRVAVGPGDRRI